MESIQIQFTLFDGQNLYAKVIAMSVPADSFLIYSNRKILLVQSAQVLNCKQLTLI